MFYCWFLSALDLADGGQTGPLMLFDQPFDIRRDRGRAGLDAAVAGIDDRSGADRLALGIVEKQNNVIVKRSLISFQGEGVIAALIDNLPRAIAG